jgi:hypothetical protein
VAAVAVTGGAADAEDLLGVEARAPPLEEDPPEEGEALAAGLSGVEGADGEEAAVACATVDATESVVGRAVTIAGRSPARGGMAEGEAARAPTVITPRSAIAATMSRAIRCIR